VKSAAAPREGRGRIASLLAALALCVPPAAAQSLSGAYTGTFDGKPATLVLQDFAVSVTGRLSVEGGYIILLNGKSSDGATEVWHRH
jgi:hypothetical protein